MRQNWKAILSLDRYAFIEIHCQEKCIISKQSPYSLQIISLTLLLIFFLVFPLCQVIDLGINMEWKAGYPNISVADDFWACEDREFRTPAPTPAYNTSCQVITNGAGGVQICNIKDSSAWIESNGDRVIQAQAIVTNIGGTTICGLQLDVDELDKALTVWPGWFPKSDVPIQPDAVVVVGANIPTDGAAPTIRVVGFDNCGQGLKTISLSATVSSHAKQAPRQLQWFRRGNNYRQGDRDEEAASAGSPGQPESAAPAPPAPPLQAFPEPLAAEEVPQQAPATPPGAPIAPEKPGIPNPPPPVEKAAVEVIAPAEPAKEQPPAYVEPPEPEVPLLPGTYKPYSTPEKRIDDWVLIDDAVNTASTEEEGKVTIRGRKYELTNCVVHKNGRAEVTLCEAGVKQWFDPKKPNSRIAQLNLLATISGEAGVCNLTVAIEGIETSTFFWPLWVNGTSNEFIEHGQVSRFLNFVLECEAARLSYMFSLAPRCEAARLSYILLYP